MTLEEKQTRLDEVLSGAGNLLVAYSGGVDSAFLAYAAHHCLGTRMLAVLADSPSLSRSHMRDAIAFAAEAGIPLRIIETHEMDNAAYVKNDASRCFHCKDELFDVMTSFACNSQFNNIAYGMNLDDCGDFRPGQQAAENHHVLAPLLEAELTKEDVRTLAKAAGLRIWDKPASACLSSRIEYGRPVTAETLRAIEDGEEVLGQLGFRQFRVRHHGEIARLEIAREELENAFSLGIFDEITRAFKAIGFKYVAIDTAGYRSGSMNVLLPASAITRARAPDRSE